MRLDIELLWFGIVVALCFWCMELKVKLLVITVFYNVSEVIRASMRILRV